MTSDDVNNLHDATSLVSLSVGDTAWLEITKIIRLIESNRTTLTQLSLSGPITGGDKTALIDLASAISKCNSLRRLAIENFAHDLADSMRSFLDSLSTLDRLTELSFKNTYLDPIEGSLGLTNVKTLKELDLSGSGLITEKFWQGLRHTLYEHHSLNTLKLCNNPISIMAIQHLSAGILSPSSQITSIEWQLPDYCQNQDLHSQLLATHQQEKKIDSEQNFISACQEFRQLQKYIIRKNDAPRKTQLVLENSDQTSLELKRFATEILLCRDSLTSLKITLPPINKSPPKVEPTSFTLFLSAIQCCRNLNEFCLDNMQATFEPPQLRKILNTLENLPITILSLKKTYLGDYGTQALANVIMKDKVQKLDLTLAGLVTDKCYALLHNSIKNNKSLMALLLGKSPMTLSWLQKLIDLIKNRKGILFIEWQSTPFDIMKDIITTMTTDLAKTQHALEHSMPIARDNFSNSPSNVELETLWKDANATVPKPTYHLVKHLLHGNLYGNTHEQEINTLDVTISDAQKNLDDTTAQSLPLLVDTKSRIVSYGTQRPSKK